MVAEEVRNLAAKSAEAAGSTTELIEGSYTAVQNGSRIAGITAQTLSEVIGQANSTSEIITKIAGEVSQQAGLVASINTSVERISTVVHSNSATSEQSAAASQQLASQAALLKQLVSHFKTRQQHLLP